MWEKQEQLSCNSAERPLQVFASLENCLEPERDVRCGFADVLDTLQRVDGVWTTEDAGSKDDGESVGGHPVGLLLQGNPAAQQSRNTP